MFALLLLLFCVVFAMFCCCFLQAAGVSQGNLRAKTSTLEVPTDQSTTKIPREDTRRGRKTREDTRRERKRMKTEGEGKKARNFGPPTLRPPTFRAPHPSGPPPFSRFGPHPSGRGDPPRDPLFWVVVCAVLLLILLRFLMLLWGRRPSNSLHHLCSV